MCSVVTKLLKSPEIRPIHCATKLRRFERTRNGYLATEFIHPSITAKSSATGDYVFVPERFSQNEEPASRKEERAMKKPSFVRSNGFNRPNMETQVNTIFIHQGYVLCFM